MDYEYFIITDLATGADVDSREDLPEFCMLGFTPKTINPSRTVIVVKANDICEMLCNDLTDDVESIIKYYIEQGLLLSINDTYVPWSDFLMVQLYQADRFLKTYQKEMVEEVFPVYAEKICEVFIKNMRYLE